MSIDTSVVESETKEWGVSLAVYPFVHEQEPSRTRVVAEIRPRRRGVQVRFDIARISSRRLTGVDLQILIESLCAIRDQALAEADRLRGEIKAREAAARQLDGHPSLTAVTFGDGSPNVTASTT